MTQSIDLNSMSQDELEKLRSDVEKALKTVQTRRMKDARDAAIAAAREHGFSLDDILGGKLPKSSKAKAPAKFMMPGDETKTWSGLGRKPQWVKDVEASDQNLEDMRIN